MILLLGATGYVGQAFATELRRRGEHFILLTRQALDYTCFEFLFDYVRKMKPDFIINAAGYIGEESEEIGELDQQEALHANALLPQKIARVCLMTNTPWGHVSSGNIYSGAKVVENREKRVERNLTRPEIQRYYVAYPERFFGFTEWDEPNHSFRCAPCTFYAGTKALAEEAIRNTDQTYIWRPAQPFNERDEPRNFLSKFQRFSKIRDGISSLSHLEDFVRACLDLWMQRAPFGIYNVANPGAVTTRQVAEMIRRIHNSNHRFEFGRNDDELYRLEDREPATSYILDVSKLLATGVRMRPVRVALEESLRKWRVETLATVVSPALELASFSSK